MNSTGEDQSFQRKK